MRATGAKWRVGLDNGHGWFLNVRVKDNGFGAIHEADYNLAVAKAAGATTNDKRLTVPISVEERKQARQLIQETDLAGEFYLAGLAPARIEQNVVAGLAPARSSPPTNIEQPLIKRPIIAMHPGSGGYSTARRWAPERFAQLADTLFHDAGGQLILMGGPEETELHRQIIELMQSEMPVRSFAGKGNIRVAAAILEQADLFVGNDSGLMHLATAVGTPTVGIFGLTNSDAWGPYTSGEPGQQAVVVKLDLPCMPCFYRGHDLGTPEGCMTRDCLAMLGVDPVATAARRFLGESRKQPHLVVEEVTKGD
jgi:heptosyltransferase-2